MGIKELKKDLSNRAIRPYKGLGQNFLIDREVLKSVVEAAGLKKTDDIIEIGPGTGILTKELLKKAKRVVAFEKDRRMCQILQESLGNFKNLEIINEDFLKSGYRPRQSYKVVANLPYYITSPIIRKLLESNKKPESMILMVQKEVGQRICAVPPEMSILSVSVQFYARPNIIRYVSKKSFWPKPKVDSVVIKITPLIDADLKPIDADLFFKIVKAGFSHPRKQLLNNLSKGLDIDRKKTEELLKKCGISPQQRAETLSIDEWISFSKILKKD